MDDIHQAKLIMNTCGTAECAKTIQDTLSRSVLWLSWEQHGDGHSVPVSRDAQLRTTCRWAHCPSLAQLRTTWRWAQCPSQPWCSAENNMAMGTLSSPTVWISREQHGDGHTVPVLLSWEQHGDGHTVLVRLSWEQHGDGHTVPVLLSWEQHGDGHTVPVLLSWEQHGDGHAVPVIPVD